MEPQPRPPLDLSTIVVPSADVLVQELDGEAVLLNLDSERYFGLDDVGTRVWQHLLEHRLLERVCEEMEKEYEVDASRLRSDVLKLIEELIEAGIVKVEQAVPGESGSS
jgi:predicted transcriptional regulator